MDNLEEIDKFLEKYNLPKLNQEETENMNRLITSQKNETVTKNLLTNKSPGTRWFNWSTLQNIQIRFNTYSQTLPKLLKGRIPSKYML